jgi:hypothetical protein
VHGVQTNIRKGLFNTLDGTARRESIATQVGWVVVGGLDGNTYQTCCAVFLR